MASNQAICYLIPDGSEMIFSAYVNAADIEKIMVGDTVNVRLTSLDDTGYEIMQGTVTSIDLLSQNLEGKGTVYPIEIRMCGVPEGGYRIGTEGVCEIIISGRTVLDYFLEPFRKGMEESLKEG